MKIQYKKVMTRQIYRAFGAFCIMMDCLILKMLFRIYGVHHSSFRSVGLPHLTDRKGARVTIGKGFRLNNRFYGNALSVQKCAIWVGENAELTIGDNVGISSSFIIATDRVTIEDNVKIGGSCHIMDTDFHSMDPEARKNPDTDRKGTKTTPVTIRENAFIGASCIILKGTVIGRNSIIGAGSVVTGNVPDNQLWAGNPARFIRQL